MDFITMLCILLMFIMMLPFLIQSILQIILRSYNFRIQIKGLFFFKNIYFTLKPQSLLFFNSFKIFISFIKIKKNPNQFTFVIFIDKIHLKLQSMDLELAPSLSHKLDEIFTINLMKIIEFTRKSMIIQKSSLETPKIIKPPSYLSKLLSLSILMKLLSFFLLSKFSIKINKLHIEMIENSSEGLVVDDFINPYENTLNKTKNCKVLFWCDYNNQV